jgi:hypothetical protein
MLVGLPLTWSERHRVERRPQVEPASIGQLDERLPASFFERHVPRRVQRQSKNPQPVRKCFLIEQSRELPEASSVKLDVSAVIVLSTRIEVDTGARARIVA